MTLAAGTRLGTYEILSPLGAGGMGEVYRARDSKLDRDVAVKVLPAAVANDPDSLARFEREAKAVAALSHPNILAIHDFGRADGIAYAVTELLEGETLRGRIDGAPVALRQAVDWSLQIARGLSAAHGRGVVHRDLKPENVFVTKDGHVKILDFGLAKRVDETAAEQKTSAPTGSGHTEPGTVMGTMGYMSPEQLRGLAVDHRSDIFSFGAVLYELLSGKKAFKRDTASDTIAAVLKEEPPELTGTGRNVSPALDHIVRHCLEKDPGDRFQSAKDVAFALSEASSPTTAVTTGAQAAVAAGSGRKKLAFAAALLAVLAAAGLFLWNRPKAPARAEGVKRVAVLPFENLGSPEDEYFTDGIADEIRGKLTSLPEVQVIARASSNPYKKTTKTPREIAEELDVQYLLTATIRWDKSGGANRVHVSPELIEVSRSGAPTSKWQQPFQAALTDVFEVQSDIASRVAESLGVALGAGDEKHLAERPTKSLPAYEAYLKGEEAAFSDARVDPPSVRRALGYYQQAVALDPAFAQAWGRIAAAEALLYANSTPFPEVDKRAIEAAEKAKALAPNDAASFRAMGTYLRLVRGDYEGARAEFEEARKRTPGDTEILRTLAATEMGLGQWDKALEHLDEAQRLDPRAPGVQVHLANGNNAMRRYPQARQAADKLLALAPGNPVGIQAYAISFLGEGNLDGARAFVVRQAAATQPAEVVAYVATYQDLGWVLNDELQDLLLRLTPTAFDDDRGSWALCLAQTLWWRGDTAGARRYAEQARDAFAEQVLQAPDASELRALHGTALAYLGRYDEAIREGERAVALSPVQKDGESGPYYLHQLARIYVLAGQQEKAVDVLERLLAMPYYVSPAWLRIDPNFDPLRSNPRFQKLLGRASS